MTVHQVTIRQRLSPFRLKRERDFSFFLLLRGVVTPVVEKIKKKGRSSLPVGWRPVIIQRHFLLWAVCERANGSLIKYATELKQQQGRIFIMPDSSFVRKTCNCMTLGIRARRHQIRHTMKNPQTF